MKFENAGRAIDRELTNLIEFLKHRAKPATRRDMAKLLRKASERLSKLADKLENVES